MGMWLDKDQAWQHVVYEHPRDADSETIMRQFQCRGKKAQQALTAYLAVPPDKRKNCVLIHNASVRRMIVKVHLVNCIDGYGDNQADWTAALDHHPLGAVMKKALTLSTPKDDVDGRIVIKAQRLAVVPLPPKPDQNWGWRGTFAYGDIKVGECRLREGGVFSFICVDCGLRVGDREERNLGVNDDFTPHPDKLNLRMHSDDFVLEDVQDVGRSHSELELLAPSAQKDRGGKDPEGDKSAFETGAKKEGEDEGPWTRVEVLNRLDEPVQIKVFESGKSGHVSRLFRSALAEGTVSPGMGRIFPLKANPDTPETDFDVEIRVGRKRAKCEVVGEQVIFVDGFLAD